MANGNEISITCFGIFNFLGINPGEIIIPTVDECYVKGYSHTYYTHMSWNIHIFCLSTRCLVEKMGLSHFNSRFLVNTRKPGTRRGSVHIPSAVALAGPLDPLPRTPGERLTDSAPGRRPARSACPLPSPPSRGGRVPFATVACMANH